MAGVSYLSTHLGIERGLTQHHLIERFAFLAHLTVTQDLGLALQLIVAHKLGLAFFQYGPVTQILLIGRAAHFFLMCQGFVIFLLVGGEAVLAQDQFGQIQWETVGVFQREHIHAADLRLTGFLGLVHQLIQQSDTLVQSAQESLLLGLDHRGDLLLLFHQFRIRLAHVGDQLRHQLVHKCAAHT